MTGDREQVRAALDADRTAKARNLRQDVLPVLVVLDNAAADVAAGRLHPDAAVVVGRVRNALPDDPSTTGDIQR